jgi:hypothetical protein
MKKSFYSESHREIGEGSFCQADCGDLIAKNNYRLLLRRGGSQ